MLINPHASYKELEAKINKASSKIANYTDKVIKFELEPLERSYYFKDSMYGYYSPIYRYRSNFFLKSFVVITIIILLLASVNFINYSQTLAIIRFNKVRILKILGASVPQLLGQLLIENIIIFLTSFSIAILIIAFLLPTFNYLTDSNVSLNFLINNQFVFTISGIILTACLLLTFINWILILYQNNLASKSTGAKLFNLLSIVQIYISSILLFIIIVFFKQLQFIKSFPIGLNKENLLTVYISNVQGPIDPRSIKTEILRNSQVVEASLANGSPLSNKWFYSENAGNEEVKINVLTGDESYLSTLQLNLIEGREFNKENPSDSSSIVISELTAKKLSLGLDSLYNKKRVIGIFGDIQLSSIRDKVEPTVISYRTFKIPDDNMINLIVRLNQIDQNLLDKIRNDIAKFLPDSDVDFIFLDSEINALYKNDFKQGQLLFGMATVVILITIFGIVGLIYFNTERRKKEIAIRKVFGAYSLDIIQLFLIKILKTTFLTTLTSMPVAIYLMDIYLNGFAYKTTIDWWVAPLTFLIITSITIVSTAYNIIASANDNPVKSLKYE